MRDYQTNLVSGKEKIFLQAEYEVVIGVQLLLGQPRYEIICLTSSAECRLDGLLHLSVE